MHGEGARMDESRPFKDPPAFEGENLIAWWVNAPGIYAFVPRKARVLSEDCQRMTDAFCLRNVERQFPGSSKLRFLFNLRNSTGYESEARVAITNWGRSFPSERFGESLNELSESTPAIVRMGVAAGAAALAVLGRKVTVISSLDDYCDAHAIAVVPPRFPIVKSAICD